MNKKYEKGSTPRPYSVNYKTFFDRWYSAFGKKKKKSKVVKIERTFTHDSSDVPKTVDVEKPKSKGKLSSCPHCATMNLKQINSFTKSCKKCGWSN